MSAAEAEGLKFRHKVAVGPVVKNRRQAVNVQAIFVDLLFLRQRVEIRHL